MLKVLKAKRNTKLTSFNLKENAKHEGKLSVLSVKVSSNPLFALI
jgi:hypothetical protein